MKTVFFKIADISFSVCSNWALPVTENYLPFVTPPLPTVQEALDVQLCASLPEIHAPITWKENFGHSFLGEQRVLLHRHGETLPVFCMEISTNAVTRSVCYPKSSHEEPKDINKLFDQLRLESLLLRHDGLILHSSFIRWRGNGILFSAPSGTGKSTQADLWKRYQDAEILNGDRAGLRKKNGRWTAYGLPYAGSSDIFRNESAPIRCIVMLEQGPENIISTMTPGQAFRRIYPEVMLHRWDEEFLSKSLDLLTDLLTAVPVYRLICRPDQEAVELLYDTITHED